MSYDLSWTAELSLATPFGLSIQIAGLLSDDLLKIAHIHLLICEGHAADANARWSQHLLMPLAPTGDLVADPVARSDFSFTRNDRISILTSVKFAIEYSGSLE
jgi:hypothetical protein